MNLKKIKSKLLLVLILSAVGCSKGNPKINGSESNLEVDLASSSQKISSASQPVVISGTCDARMMGIEVAINQAAWVDAESVAATKSITCSKDKKFTFTLDPSATSISSYLGLSLTQTESRKIRVRGKTIIGSGKPADFTLIFEPATPLAPPGRFVASGNSGGANQLSSSINGYKLHGRIGSEALYPSGTNESTSTNFILKSGMQKGF